MRIDHIWYQTSKQTDLYSGQPRFKHLTEFANFYFCKFKFSTIRNIYTDSRHNLGKDATQGHAFSSLYTETISMRNNLLGILMPKVNIFGKKKLACSEWEPTKSVFAQVKSATYRLGKTTTTNSN